MRYEQHDAVSEQQFDNINGEVLEINARTMEKTVISIPTLILHIIFLIVLTIIELTICSFILVASNYYVGVIMLIFALIIIFLISVAAIFIRNYFLFIIVCFFSNFLKLD